MKWLYRAALCLLLVLAVGGQVSAQTQVTVKGALYQAGTPQVTAIDQEHWVAVEDLRGVKIDTTTGSGPLTDMTADNKLVLFGDKNVIHFHGYLTLMDKDGDKMVYEISDASAASPGKAAGKIVASTGRFAGMEGTIETTIVGLTPFQDGARYSIGYCVEKLTFKTPL